jgi:hypothetical protein
MQCQGRPTGDAYNETNTNRDGPWYGTGDVATRSSNVGFDEVSSVPSVSRSYVSTRTSTATGGTSGGTGAAGRNAVSVGLTVAAAAVVAAAL